MRRFTALLLLGWTASLGCGRVAEPPARSEPGTSSRSASDGLPPASAPHNLSRRPLEAANEPAAATPRPGRPDANVLTGLVVAIADGDTLTVLDASKTQHRIRLEGIDTPERGQAYGTRAREALGAMAFQKDARVEWSERDRYRRILGHVYVDDRWVNKAMVEEGWAWHYRQYSDDPELAVAEQRARAAKLGLWADPHPVPPWEYRRNPGGSSESNADVHDPRDTAAGKATVYVTRTGAKYHRDGCRYLSKSKIPISLEDARRRYGPCSVCRPPTR